MEARPRRLLGALLFLFVAALGAAPVAAQGGYDTEKYPGLGLEMPIARHYEAVPTQPGEEHIALKFWEKKEVTERYERRSRPTMDIVIIDWAPDPEPEEDEEGPRTSTEPKEAKKNLPITTFERFRERRLGTWSPGDVEEYGKDLDGMRGTERPLVPSSKSRSRQLGWAFTWVADQERTIAVIGFADKDDFDDQVKIWRRTAEKLELIEKSTKEIDKLRRAYERQRNILDPEFRIKVRSAMVDGWEAEDTDNYIVIYSTRDQPLVRRICKEIEQIRRAYVDLFPPVEPVTAVSTVRVCKDREEYIKYGGSPRSAGYWNSAKEELVFYDASAGRRVGDEDTFIVLYHEAFHQYIHYSSGELPPHSWFNEGHGDYFSGALIKGGRLKKIGINPWRVRTIQTAVEQGKHVPWDKILHYEQADYYRNARLCYAQGWAMIHFLRESRDAQRHDQWNRILPTYFNELKAAYADELEKAGHPEEMKDRMLAGKAARDRAVKAAFEGIDLRELEDEWVEYVKDLRVPD